MSSSRTLNFIRSRNLIINNSNSLKSLTAIAYTLCQVLLKLMKNLTVKELIEQLKKFDENKEVQISAVGFSSKDSWDAPLTLEELTVDEFKEIVRINFSLYG